MIARIDTSTATKMQIARFELINGYNHFLKEEYNECIQAIDPAEEYFIEVNDQYYIHLATLIRGYALEMLPLYRDEMYFFSEADQYFYQNPQLQDTKKLQDARLETLDVLHRYATIDKEKHELRKKIRRYWGYGSFIIVALVLLVWWYNYRLRRNSLKMNSLKKTNKQIKVQINKLRQSLEQQEEQKAELANQVQTVKQKNEGSHEVRELLEAIKHQEISNWPEFEACFNQLRPNWVNKLKKEKPKLTPTDIKYCMCFYFNLNNYSTSKILENGPDAVKSAKRRIRDKLELKDSKEIYTYLKQFDRLN